jgi:predicted phosphodiesterase
MKTVVFSDVHGNLPALEAVLEHAGPADRYVCLGDVVNYGPWSHECAERIAGLPNCDRLMGNHDEAFLTGGYCGEHPLARAFFDFCFPRFQRRELLLGYVEACDVGAFRAQHTLNGSYVYADTPLQLDRNYFIGHSHHQFAREVDGYRLFNAGSVGQNRGDLRVCHYLIHGPGARDVRLAGCVHDPMPVIEEMRRQNYPTVCVDYYLGKIGRGAPVLPAQP